MRNQVPELKPALSRTRRSIGFSFGQYCSAIVRLMIVTRSARLSSVGVNPRPASSGIRIVEKYSGDTCR